MRVYFHTFGCKANQYDTERMRQESEALGATAVRDWGEADVCVVNTCTVTNQADAEARSLVRRIRRANPRARLVVAGCSAALRASDYRAMEGVSDVIPGPDPIAVAGAVTGSPAARPLVQLGARPGLDGIDAEPVGAQLLRRRVGGTRGWIKIQDGCDRHCAFCATRLARGASRSRAPEMIVREAALLAGVHPELVVTGIHIGQYGHDLERPATLSGLVAELLDCIPDVRIRLGSVEATEVDDALVSLIATSGGRIAPHLHMPLQSGADPVLHRMRRWHTRDAYRRRALEIAERVPVLGLGADVITGFPGETDEDHAATRALVEEIPFTYLHVFPFSPKAGTAAADLHSARPVPPRVATERARELRDIAESKARAHRRGRAGQMAEVTVEARGVSALTGDYLRVGVRHSGECPASGRLHRGVLRSVGDAAAADLYIDLTRSASLN